MNKKTNKNHEKKILKTINWKEWYEKITNCYEKEHELSENDCDTNNKMLMRCNWNVKQLSHV